MILQVEQIDTFYDVFQAIFKVSLSLEGGDIVCLLGRNGAGKTTTLKSIVGLNPPRSGSIRFKGVEIVGKKSFQIARLGVALVPEDRRIFSQLTVRENLDLGQRGSKNKKAGMNIDKIYELFPRLKNLERHLGGTLSGGEQQMLTIGRALMGDPELILVDEPTAGLSPLLVQMLGDQIRKLEEQGVTILMTEQNALFAMDLSQRAYVLDKGAIVYEGSVEGLRARTEMIKGYLGV